MLYLAVAISFVQVALIKGSEEMILSSANAVKIWFAAIRYYLFHLYGMYGTKKH